WAVPAEFLDSLLSNDIESNSIAAGVDATLLTHKRRMLAEVRVLRSEDEHLLDTERPALQALFDALRQFGIGYRAELHKRTLERGLLSLIGPNADRAVPRAPGPGEHQHVASEVDGHAVRVIRTDLGIDVLCESEHTAAVAAALSARGALPIDPAVGELVRIERGRPRFGVEIDETTMPQEAGLHERAVSYSKGCYIGQETVARLYWRGKPNRHLRGLRLSGPAAPGARLVLGDAAVGTLGSFAQSPRHGSIGLGLIRREAAPGDVVSVGEGPESATIVELPFDE
ncbi:MAG: YgfZ/GcvT domain-containing protein, partial [Solirubrobacteraceae bacterium]